jgi:hypothetical protein
MIIIQKKKFNIVLSIYNRSETYMNLINNHKYYNINSIWTTMSSKYTFNYYKRNKIFIHVK